MSLQPTNLPFRQLPPLPSHSPLPRSSVSLNRYALPTLAPTDPTSHFHLGRVLPSQPSFSQQQPAVPMASSADLPVFPHTQILVPPRPFTVPTDQAFLEEFPPKAAKRSHAKAFSAGRPRLAETKKPRYDPRARPTKLRIDKPVQANIHPDIWDQVFRFTDSRTLLSLRATCRTFYHILGRSSIWSDCRTNTTADAPPPPPNFEERHYVDLLEGSGCTSCGARKTRRVQWAFLSRFCDKCFKTKTMTTSEAQAVNTRYPNLLLCIPRCTSDHWGIYKETIGGSDPSAHLVVLNASILMLKSDITRIIHDYEAFLSTISAEPEQEKLKLDWLTEKKGLMDSHLAELRTCEKWDQSRHSVVKNSRERLIEERTDFFHSKGQTLTPPMSKEALDRIPAFRQACRQPRQPTERAWSSLLKKIEQYRTHAEEQLRVRVVDPILRMKYQSCNLIRAEKGLDPVLRDLAGSVLEDLTTRGTVDEDLLHLAFREIWQRYYEIPVDDRPRRNVFDVVHGDEVTDAYVLCMDDARKIYEKVIEPFVREWSTPRKYNALDLLKCPICIRKDYSTRWTFRSLFAHLVRHGSECGSDLKEWYDASKDLDAVPGFAFCAVRWPLNLPMLAPHQKPTGHWYPSDETPYQLAPPSQSSANPSAISAYDGRRASPKPGVDLSDFVALIIFASAAFSKTAITPAIKSQVAWKYACDLLSTPPTLPLEHLKPLTFEIMRTGDFSLLSSVVCQVCALRDTHHSQIPRWGKREYTMAELSSHLVGEHQYDFSNGKRDWKTELLTLPTENAVWCALQEDGMESARHVFDSLFPRCTGETAVRQNGVEPQQEKESRSLQKGESVSAVPDVLIDPLLL